MPIMDSNRCYQPIIRSMNSFSRRRFHALFIAMRALVRGSSEQWRRRQNCVIENATEVQCVRSPDGKGKSE